MTNSEKQAEELIQDLGIVLPISPINVCELISTNESKVNYQEKQFNSLDICGVSMGDISQATISVNSNIELDTRKLFTAAHEIGHVVLHIQTGKNFECNNNDLQEDNKQFEKEANQFASALLMPGFLIQDDINNNDLSWQLVKNIANKCKTSYEATARRIISLSKEPCALLIHQNNKPWYPIKSSHWPWYLGKVQFPDQLDYCHYEDLTDNMEECNLSDWDIDNIENDEYQCKYSSIHFQDDSVDRIMTLLFLEER